MILRDSNPYLRDPAVCRRVMVRAVASAQQQSGRSTTLEDAERAYDQVQGEDRQRREDGR